MGTRSEIQEFLTSRRARITPEESGLSAHGNRRVPGLRREEVAVLAGISASYYGRLERGDAQGVSDGVLDALARALQLDDTDRQHLFELARVAPRPTVSRSRRRPPEPDVRPSVRHFLDAITGAAAFVRNDQLDILAANGLGEALYHDLFNGQAKPANGARFIFADSRSRDFYPDWGKAADDAVSALRKAAARDPHSRRISDLVGELSTQNEEFRTRWAARRVSQHTTGVKHFHHPVVGDLSLTYESLDLVADPGLIVVTYTAQPGSRDEETLRLLGSWSATNDEQTTTPDHRTELP